VLAFATAAAGNARIEDASDPRLAGFRDAFAAVLMDLALQIVRDGEGASKFVTVIVSGAESDASAKKIARTICESPLVKTAIAGEDANWGRIVMAAGRADERIVKNQIGVRFGPLWAARAGMASPDYDEAAMSAYMQNAELEIEVTVGSGPGRARMYTCDFTKRYIEINGDYRS
jgi:glutamate N-acetyltransferase/amino-acid N-acetyltransferase